MRRGDCATEDPGDAGAGEVVTDPAREYRVRIRCNATGEVRVVSSAFDWERESSWEDWRDGLVFQWTDGNFGCDCNRELFFRDAGGEEFDADAVQCLPSGRYTVIDVACPNGEVIPIDTEADA